MAAIDELIKEIADPLLREKFEKEIEKSKNGKKLGLVFEEHPIGHTPLYDVPIKNGSLVAPRGEEIKETFTVLSVENDTAHCVSDTDKSHHDFHIGDITAVAKNGEPVYPYLQEIDRVCRAPESGIWHTLIESDNYYALQFLKHEYAGKVDCIYIDPPYNTGATDWKYNNRFTDSGDRYPHSKWLSFMKHRLETAKGLLNPNNSVLIVAIDEKEYLRLGMLLEDIFEGARIQMISSCINPAGSTRKKQFSRTDEYYFFVELGDAAPSPLPLPDEWSAGNKPVAGSDKLIWESLKRRKSNSFRTNSPRQFYPIFVTKDGKKIVKIGDPLSVGEKTSDISVPEGCVAVFPYRNDGTEGIWQLSPEKCRYAVSKGYVKLGKFDKFGGMSVKYLKAGEQKKVEDGIFKIIGYNEDGSIITDVSDSPQQRVCGTQWRISAHNASTYGTPLLAKMIGRGKFQYPKSLYAVEDCIRFFVSDKPNALVLDFFAGSGTTAHAVMLLNHLDGGHRRCISITNNEVSEKEEKAFRKKGLHPGDDEWEAHGVARFVTWPRIKAAITGMNPDGDPVKGNYKFHEEFPISDGFAENAVYFRLGLLDENTAAGIYRKNMPCALWQNTQ